MQNKKNLQILLGCFVYVVGVNLFLAPVGVFTTGFMGLAQEITALISNIFHLDITNVDEKFILIQTTIYWLFNIPVMIFAYFKISKKFAIKTFIISSVVMQLLFNIVRINTTLIIGENGQTLSATLLSVIVGSVLIGIGLSLIVKNHASGGGTDVLAIYLSLFKGKSFGLYNFLLNTIVVIGAILLTQDYTMGILILISLYIQGYVIDKFYNYNQKETMTVFTTHGKKIGEKIIQTNRTFTQVKGESGFSKKEIAVLMIILNSEEKSKFTKLVIDIDKDAFISFAKTENVKGNFKNRYLTEL